MKRVLIILAILIPSTILTGQKNDLTDPEQYAFAKSVQKRNQNKKECDELVELRDSLIKYSYDKTTNLFYPVQVIQYTYDSRHNLTVNHFIGLPERTNILRQVFEYDNSDNQKKYTNYNWVDGAWEKTLYVERSYDQNDEITTEVYNRKETDGTFVAYMRHYYSYSGGRPINYLRQLRNAAGEWYDFSYHNYVYDYMDRLAMLYGQYINGPVFWERTSVFEGDSDNLSERYFRQLKYDPVLKQNILTNNSFEKYTYNIYGNASEILYHGWIDNSWAVNGKALIYYSLIPGKKVSICHNGKTICVSTHAVRAHLEHGDKLGACPTPESSQAEPEPQPDPFTVYPNPARDYLTISFAEESHNYTTGYIIGAGGRIAQSFNSTGRSEVTVDISALKSGSYYVKLIGTTLTDSQRFIKK